MASATKARLASSFTCRSSMEGWKAKSNWSSVLLEGKVGHLGPGGKIALPPGRHLGAQQLFQHLGVGQLLVGGNVQGVVQDLDGLLESQSLQVLAGLLQGNHPCRLPRRPARTRPESGAPPHPLGPAPPPLPGVAGHPPWAVLLTGWAG